MRKALLHESHLILAVVQVVHDARRGCPLRALGRLGEGDAPEGGIRHEHQESDRLAVGRPLRIRRGFGQPRHLRRRSLRIHPAHEDLGALGLAVREVEDAGAVGRPACVRPLHEEAVMRPIRAHDPERRVPFVVDLVDPAARVHDLRSVGGDLRIGDLLPIEVMVDGEQRVGSGFLGGRGQRGSRPQQHRKTQRARHRMFLVDGDQYVRSRRAVQ